MSPLKSSLIVLSVVLALAACQKKQAEPAASSETPAPAAPAATASPPAAAPDATAATEVDPEVAKRKAAVEFALAEQKIADDPQGQWATTAKASSTYGSGDEKSAYMPWQATGAPNVQRYSDAHESWASKEPDLGIEWLELGFAKPVHAAALKIRQNHAPGAIIKIELVDDQGSKHTVFSGVDSTTYPEQTISWFSPTFEKTSYLVKGAVITLATNAVNGWNEIDAVQLVGE